MRQYCQTENSSYPRMPFRKQGLIPKKLHIPHDKEKSFQHILVQRSQVQPIKPLAPIRKRTSQSHINFPPSKHPSQ